MKRKKFDLNAAPAGHRIGWVWSRMKAKFERKVLRIAEPGVRTPETDRLLALKHDALIEDAGAREIESARAGKSISINALTGEIVTVANDDKTLKPKGKTRGQRAGSRFAGWAPPVSAGREKSYYDPETVYKSKGPGLVIVEDRGMWQHVNSDNMALLEPDQPLQHTSRALLEMSRGWDKGKCPKTWNLTRDLLEQIEAEEILSN